MGTLNSLTKNSRIAKRSQLGAVYTTDILASWSALVLNSMLASKDATIVDPACGDGALLKALSTRGVANLVGVDCDTDALKQAHQRLPGACFCQADGLAYLAEAARQGGTLDAVIANPPWGAALRIDRATLGTMGYRALSGQTDSWDLFVDGILRALKPNAPAVLILPDALLLPEHRLIRGILARESHITMIARLGEGFFSGVFRGTVVIGVRKGLPKPKAVVACSRLLAGDRKRVLAGHCTLADAIEQSVHNIAQERFLADPDHRFDIDSQQRDHVRLAAIEERSVPWDRWFDVGRGIELSKTGRVVRCPNCPIARPVPRGSHARCANCRHVWSPDKSGVDTIIRHNDGVAGREWYPLIVGEDVDRYSCTASRLIRMNVTGIRYKPLETFAQPKLLVRKTGVGIKASVDASGAATNQVVFHFTCRRDTPAMLLDYLAGILCSRVMLAWHLKRQGELEWRSHPYITPRILRGFPVPMPDSEDDWGQAAAIAAAVQSRRRVIRHDSLEDLAVERLVAGMYGLSEEDMVWVLSVLDSAQQLEPIRTLRLAKASLVSPLRIRKGAA